MSNLTDQDPIKWFIDHADPMQITIPEYYLDNEGLVCAKELVQLACKRIPYPMGDVGAMVVKQNLESLVNFPRISKSINLPHNNITEIDFNLNASSINLARNKITSVKDIHTKIKCEYLTIFNNPIKGPMLSILLIPGLKTLVSGGTLPEYAIPNQALDIICKHIGRGRSGIIAAQQELFDNDLDEYAAI